MNEKQEVFTIRNAAGMEADILAFGATLQRLRVPAGAGRIDVVLGFDTEEEYRQHSAGCYGGLIGRHANRIEGASFTIDGTAYHLTPNCPVGNHIHGGLTGFHQKRWTAEPVGESTLRLRYFSPDGEEGYPGNLPVTVTYTITEDNGLRIDYEAAPDKDTVVNLTSHGYFNLNGGGSILDHTLRVDADAYAESDGGMPTGKLLPVAGTCFDFRQEKPLGRDILDPMLEGPGGYDHNFCLNGSGLRPVAELRGDRLAMTLETTYPGMQLYSAAFHTPTQGKDGAVYEGRCFVCMEAEYYPNAMRHGNFPSVVVRKGETYRETTIYRFRDLTK